jgi:hypothetical protein
MPVTEENFRETKERIRPVDWDQHHSAYFAKTLSILEIKFSQISSLWQEKERGAVGHFD